MSETGFLVIVHILRAIQGFDFSCVFAAVYSLILKFYGEKN